MTAKQIAILETALRLFAEKGYNAVSTSVIARDAGVSEGLIFRHFSNKQGLLDAIMQMGKNRVSEQLDQLFTLNKPEEIIQHVMELPFSIDKKDYPFWRLLYALKWQTSHYDDQMSKPIKTILMHALERLNYTNVEMEANLIMSYIDGFATTVLLKGDQVDKDELLKILRTKYKHSKNN